MDFTITDNPPVKQQQTAWTVTGQDYMPVKLWLPNRSRCWSYFTKQAGRVLAEHTRGYLDVTRTHSIKEVVTEIPAEVTAQATTAQGGTEIETPGDTTGLAADYDEAAALGYLGQLVDLEQRGARNDVKVGPYSLFTMIGALQMVLRHPDLGTTTRRVITDLVEQWRVPFNGTPGEPLINMGYDPAFDGDGRRNCAGTFDKWLEDKYPDAFLATDIKACVDDLRDAWFAGRASLTPEKEK